MRAAPQAAPEFAPLSTFEMGESPAAAVAVDTADARGPVVAGSMAPVSDAGAMNPDWLSEVHASLTKLAATDEDDAPHFHMGAGADMGHYGAPRATKSNMGRNVAIAVVVFIVLVLLAIGSTFLPTEYRPFDMPPAVTHLIDSFNQASPPSNYETPAPGR